MLGNGQNTVTMYCLTGWLLYKLHRRQRDKCCKCLTVWFELISRKIRQRVIILFPGVIFQYCYRVIFMSYDRAARRLSIRRVPPEGARGRHNIETMHHDLHSLVTIRLDAVLRHHLHSTSPLTFPFRGSDQLQQPQELCYITIYIYIYIYIYKDRRRHWHAISN